MTAGLLGVIQEHGFPCLAASSRVTCGPRMTVPADYPLYAMVGGFISPPTTQSNSICAS